MKVLHVLYSGLGGHANVFFSFINADENKRFDYEAIFAGNEIIRKEYTTRCDAQNITWTYIRKRKKLDQRFNRDFVTAIRASEARIILIQGSRFIMLAKLAALLSKNKKKIVIVETQANNLKTKLEWMWLLLALLFANRIIFLTDSFKEEIRKKFSWIYNPKKIGVINNGLDLNLFKPAAKTQTANTVVLGMQSRIVPIKDHATLLKAFALLQTQHPDLKLHLKIAGDGESLEDMRQLTEKLKISNEVLFTGMLDETGLVGFLQSLDIYIHASFGETMSTAIMQAMACKLPIIASDVPGINNMIENNKTGILVPVKNETALADAINYLISNPARANEMKEAAFRFSVLHYSNKIMFEKYSSVFENIL